MDFTELTAEVVSITARPDLTTEIEAAVKAATLKAHSSDYYFNDLVEVAVQFDECRFIQTFDPSSIVPAYRQVKYMRIWNGDAAAGTYGKFLQHIQIAESLDPYGYNKADVFYMAGNFLQLRAKLGVEKILFGAYSHPVVTPVESYKSWIAVEYPYAIINEAARRVFMHIGYKDQAASMARLVAEDYRTLSVSNVDVVPT